MKWPRETIFPKTPLPHKPFRHWAVPALAGPPVLIPQARRVVELARQSYSVLLTGTPAEQLAWARRLTEEAAHLAGIAERLAAVPADYSDCGFYGEEG
jgi:hypothetical protein